jgi:hypothetical protein
MGVREEPQTGEVAEQLRIKQSSRSESQGKILKIFLTETVLLLYTRRFALSEVT